MKKIIYILLLLFVLSIFLFNKQEETYTIPQNSIRFRIIANSNTNVDQNTKKLIKQDLENSFFPLLENSKSKEETQNIILENEPIISNIIDKYNIPYNINYGDNYFPSKEYLGKTYDAGNYESLVISLGEGVGNNWWCVMYPPLCLLETQSEPDEEIEYTSFFKEIISKIMS